MSDIKYPEQIIKIARTDKTLGVDAKLSEANIAAGQSPLEIHSGFSRFVFTILQKAGKGYEFVSANLPPSEIDLIRKKTDIAIEKWVEKSLEKAPAQPIAYLTTFFTGPFKGKTPADVLIDNAGNKEALLNYSKQLEANVAKYPNNKKAIDAIKNAIELLDAGKLNATEVKSQVIDIYRADIRAPHANKKDADGYTDVYSFSVICDLTKNYPFAVNIMNCKATINSNANGTQTPNMSKIKDKKEFGILLTEAEWYKVMSKMDSINKLFEQNAYPALAKKSKDALFDNSKK